MNEQVTPDCVLRMCVEVEALKAIFSLLRHWQFPDQGAAAALIYNSTYSKEITLPLRAVQSVCYTVSCWRRKRDLNPRAGFPTYSLSRGAPSPLGYFSKWWNQNMMMNIQYTASKLCTCKTSWINYITTNVICQGVFQKNIFDSELH